MMKGETVGPARINWRDLADKPTLAQGQADDLKIDTGQTRYWLCRCGIADGMLYEHTIGIERLIDGRWELVDEYDGDDA